MVIVKLKHTSVIFAQQREIMKQKQVAVLERLYFEHIIYVCTYVGGAHEPGLSIIWTGIWVKGLVKTGAINMNIASI